MNILAENIEIQPTGFVLTNLGQIAVYSKTIESDKPPVIFLHGVYFDHHLWHNQVDQINDRTVVTIDMPLHGKSKMGVPQKWTLADCGDILIEILDSLNIPKVIAVGHSWGSMTILRAACKYPDRFEYLGFCNMPFESATEKQKRTFRLQHSMLVFRNFYTNQVAKALFGKNSLKENPLLINKLKTPMSLLSNRDIKQVDEAVILNADDATKLITSLKVKALALKGEEDYVPDLPSIETVILKGGHISPLERPAEVNDFINRIIIGTTRVKANNT